MLFGSRFTVEGLKPPQIHLAPASRRLSVHTPDTTTRKGRELRLKLLAMREAWQLLH